MKRKGHVVFELCTPEGEIERATVAKSHGRPELIGRDGYKYARKLRWGDLWPFANRTVIKPGDQRAFELEAARFEFEYFRELASRLPSDVTDDVDVRRLHAPPPVPVPTTTTKSTCSPTTVPTISTTSTSISSSVSPPTTSSPTTFVLRPRPRARREPGARFRRVSTHGRAPWMGAGICPTDRSDTTSHDSSKSPPPRARPPRSRRDALRRHRFGARDGTRRRRETTRDDASDVEDEDVEDEEESSARRVERASRERRVRGQSVGIASNASVASNASRSRARGG